MRKTLILGLVFVAALSGADIAGTWLGQIPVQSNNTQRLKIGQQIAFQLVLNGSTLTGKMYGDYDSSPIIEGKVTGDAIDFVVMAQEQQGNQINQSRLHFSGTLLPDGTIELSRVRESSTNSGNGGAYKGNGKNGKNTFVIKRLPS
jgi:hypothetical protein